MIKLENTPWRDPFSVKDSGVGLTSTTIKNDYLLKEDEEKILSCERQ